MEIVTLKIADLKEIPEFREFYVPQPIDDLVMSYQMNGQLTPIHITEDKYIINGYRMTDAIKQAGGETIHAIVLRIKPLIYDRILLNQSRLKTTRDQVNEIKYLFKKFPKRQGVKDPTGGKYVRDELISAALNNRFKGDKQIKKLEEIINNDLDSDLLLSGIIERHWKVDTCHEFATVNRKVDEANKYGYTEKVLKGEISASDANKLIKQMDELAKGIDFTFKIPEKGYSYNMDCLELSKMEEYRKLIKLLFTSVPYYILKNYQNGDPNQLGHEKTPIEYCDNVAKIIGQLVPTLHESANVMINIGETYDNGVGYGIPMLLKQSIEKNTSLIYKDTLIWTKPNPKPQNENIQRPINNLEYILWFVVDPKKAKYNMLTYPVQGKEPKMSKGAKDVDKNGKVWDKNLSISKPYGKIYAHLKEQEIEKIIECSVGKNHDIYQVCKEGHPAIMSSMLPVIPILMTTDEGDIVFDPFSGSNVVSRMALLLNRKFLSTELSSKYFKIGCRVIEKSIDEFDKPSLDFISNEVYSHNNQNDLSNAA